MPGDARTANQVSWLKYIEHLCSDSLLFLKT